MKRYDWGFQNMWGARGIREYSSGRYVLYEDAIQLINEKSGGCPHCAKWVEHTEALNLRISALEKALREIKDVSLDCLPNKLAAHILCIVRPALELK